MAYVNPNITNIISNGVQNLQAQMQAQAAQLGAYQNQIQLGQMQAHVMETPYPEDPDLWSDDERLKMVVWFMKMHHEEDIKGFKAMRDIERSIERADREEQIRKYWEHRQQAMQNGSLYTAISTTSTWGATNAVNTINPYARVSAALEEPKKESWWKKLLK
jgi:hypothetical protein